MENELTPGAMATISYANSKLSIGSDILSGNAGLHFTVLALKSISLTMALMNLIFFPVRRIGVSTRLKSYNPHAALARRGVYGVVVSGDMTVIEYLVSSREPERVKPAQPEPITRMDCFDEDIVEKVISSRAETFGSLAQARKIWKASEYFLKRTGLCFPWARVMQSKLAMARNGRTGFDELRMSEFYSPTQMERSYTNILIGCDGLFA